MTLMAALVLAVVSPLRAASNADEWLKSGLLQPDLVASVSEELALSPEQQEKLNQLLEAARAEAVPLEKAVKKQKVGLNQVLQDYQSSYEQASAQLTKLIEEEARLKQLQLRVLLEIRSMLTVEQVEKAKRLGAPKLASQVGGREGRGSARMPAKLGEKLNQLKTAAEGLGVPPTQALQQRGDEITALVKKGDMQAAEAAADRLLEDSHLKELTTEPVEVDFSKYEPGVTDVATLQQRFESVKTASQKVVSLVMIRDLLKAKEAFEKAKEAQDAEQVGRILTYVEGCLQPR